MPPSRRLLPLRLYYLASFAALGAYNPFFPRWLEARGLTGLSMGAVAALLPAMGVLGPPVVGLGADALGLRGSLLRVACLGAAFAMGALAALGRGGTVPSFGAVFAAVLAYAVFRSPMIMLADVVTMERVAAAGTTYGRVRLWGSVGFLAAVLAVGWAVDPRAAVSLPAVIGALLLLALCAAWPLPAAPASPRLPVVREARGLLAAPSFAIFLAVSLLAQMAHVGYDLCFSLHLRDLGASDARIGVAWAVGVVFEVALMALSEPIFARSSPPRLILAALAGASARWVLLATVPSVTVLCLLQPLHAVSFGLWWMASVAYVRERAPAGALATGQGLFSAATAVGSVAGMLAWGAVYRSAGGAAVFGGAAVVALCGVALGTAWQRRV